MLLAKSCHMKDNLKKRKTLKLGTLHEYRETEIEQIADPHEGSLTFKLKFLGKVDIDRKWFNTIFSGAIRFGHAEENESDEPIRFPGGFSAHIEKIATGNTTKDKIEVIDSSATITREALNSFVFCMSHIRKTSDCIGIFPEYDDYWYMTASKAEAFGVAVGQLLLEKIKTEHKKGNYIVPNETCTDNIEVYLEHGNVSYVPREIHITNDGSISLNDFMSKMSSMAFIKPPIPFEKEKEYRYQYTIVSEGKIIVPTVKYLILEAEQLTEFLL